MILPPEYLDQTVVFLSKIFEICDIFTDRDKQKRKNILDRCVYILLYVNIRIKNNIRTQRAAHKHLNTQELEICKRPAKIYDFVLVNDIENKLSLKYIFILPTLCNNKRYIEC